MALIMNGTAKIAHAGGLSYTDAGVTTVPPVSSLRARRRALSQRSWDHTQTGTTMNLYSHVMPSLRREAADVMDRALAAIT